MKSENNIFKFVNKNTGKHSGRPYSKRPQLRWMDRNTERAKQNWDIVEFEIFPVGTAMLKSECKQ